MNAKITARRVQRHHRIAVQGKICQGRGHDAGGFIFRLIEHFPRTGRDEDMGFLGIVPGIPIGRGVRKDFMQHGRMVGFDHFIKKLLNGAGFIGQHAAQIVERGATVLLMPDHDAAMEQRPGQHSERRFAPMVFKTFARRIDQHSRHILSVGNSQHGIKTDFLHRIEEGGRAGHIRRVEPERRVPLRTAETRRKRPVFALYV